MVAAVLVWGGVLQAQTAAARLRVLAVTGASTFHIGERISLELAFSAPAASQLAVVMGSHQRGACNLYEKFEVSPGSGSSDPLAVYFATGPGGGSCASGVVPLSDEPVTMRVDLNEWVRFDRPGNYAVRIRSTRVMRPDTSFPGNPADPVQSNELRLHLVAATPAWQHARLVSALAALPVQAKQFDPPSPTAEEAIADLRFLGTAESVPVLAAGLGDDQTDRNAAFAFGLMGLPPGLHELARKTLLERLEDPSTAVPSWLIVALADLETAPASNADEAFTARMSAFHQVLEGVLAAVPKKADHARAATLDLLLRQYNFELTGAEQESMARMLGPIFDELPDESRSTLLGEFWDLVKPSISAEAVQKTALALVESGSGHAVPDRGPYGLRSVALRRWYELDPVAAAEAAYGEIGSTSPLLNAKGLWFLPSVPKPSLEAIWGVALLDPESKANAEEMAGLMVRFGTGRFSSQVAARVRETLDEQACAPQAAMIAYVVKFDPEQARPLLREALAPRSSTACHRMLFDEVSGYETGPALTDVAMETISDPDPETAASAVRYLAAYGDERSKEPMLKRYRMWTEAWSGRASQLQSTVLTPSRNQGEEVLGVALGRGLLASQGWTPDVALRSEVMKGCVGEQMCRLVEEVAAPVAGPFAVSLFQGGGTMSIHVGAYEIPNLKLLKTKLAQFPPGTVFTLAGGVPPSDASLEQQVDTVFEEAGMSLTRGRPVE